MGGQTPYAGQKGKGTCHRVRRGRQKEIDKRDIYMLCFEKVLQ